MGIFLPRKQVDFHLHVLTQEVASVSLKSKSCCSQRAELDLFDLADLRLFLFSFFLDSSYWYSEITIRHTGGRAFGEIPQIGRSGQSQCLSVFMTPTRIRLGIHYTYLSDADAFVDPQQLRRPLPLPRGRLKAVPEFVEWPYLGTDDVRI